MGGSLSTLVGGKSVPARTLPDSFGLVPRLAPARAHPPLNLPPCHDMLYAWPPQGPIHPQPHPVPLHVVCLAPARAHPPPTSPRATTCCTPLLPRPPGRRLVAGRFPEM